MNSVTQIHSQLVPASEYSFADPTRLSIRQTDQLSVGSKRDSLGGNGYGARVPTEPETEPCILSIITSLIRCGRALEKKWCVLALLSFGQISDLEAHLQNAQRVLLNYYGAIKVENSNA
jgi:hypothetical protein